MTAVKLKSNYTYQRFRASRQLHVTQTVSLRPRYKGYVLPNRERVGGDNLNSEDVSAGTDAN